jgi:uncharacterized phage protein (TIGR01671 family)
MGVNDVSKQREIKFRAWDSVAKKMLEQITTWHHAMGLSVVLPFREFHYSPNSNWRKDDYGNFYSDNNTVYLMQYTGLKDKNGVEIYEGDVVRRHEAAPEWKDKEPSSRLFQVRWSAEGAWFELDHAAPWADGTNWSPMNAHQTAQYVEVIGNIYENSELLEAK